MLSGEHKHTFIMCPFELPATCKPQSSCSDVLTAYPTATSGYYNITLSNGTTTTVYCDMDLNYNDERGWMRVGSLNMNDLNEQCPPGFRLYEENGVRACGRQFSSIVDYCVSVTYPSHDISYSQVLGRVIGYQLGTPDALYHQFNGIDSAYVDGVSITRGNPRQHIWTFMGALKENAFLTIGKEECPCAPNSPVTPATFIGNDYFCESGNPEAFDSEIFYSDDPLWDGEQCGLIEKECCNATGIPWFHKPLQQPTTDYIELRVCGHADSNMEDTPVSIIEIYTR